MFKELKEPKSFEEQLKILKENEMVVDDDSATIQALEQYNYYRLSGYWYQFQRKNDRFKPDTNFQTVLRLYEFDRRLRQLLFCYLEIIEIFCRTQIAYYFSHSFGKNGHYDSKNFRNAEYHQEFKDSLDSQIDKNKDAPFVSHHICEYGGKMPLWCAVEIMPFTMLSKFYANIRLPEQDHIAKMIGHDNSYLPNWLHCFGVLRNICAHYGRLYNRFLSPPIKLGGKTLRNYNQIDSSSLFAYIIAMLRILPEAGDANYFRDQLINLVEIFTEVIDLGLLGFPSDWKTLLYDQKLVRLS